MMLRTGRTSGSGTSQRSRRPGAATMTTRPARSRYRVGAFGVNRGAEPRSVLQRVMVRSIEAHDYPSIDLATAYLAVPPQSRSLRHGANTVADRGRFSWLKIGASMETSIRIDRVVILRGDAPEPDRLAHHCGEALGPHLFRNLDPFAFDRAHADL